MISWDSPTIWNFYWQTEMERERERYRWEELTTVRGWDRKWFSGGDVHRPCSRGRQRRGMWRSQQTRITWIIKQPQTQCCGKANAVITGIVQPKMNIQTSFTHPHVVPEPYYCCSSMERTWWISEYCTGHFSMQLQWMGTEAFKLQKKTKTRQKGPKP